MKNAETNIKTLLTIVDNDDHSSEETNLIETACDSKEANETFRYYESNGYVAVTLCLKRRIFKVAVGKNAHIRVYF